MLLFLDFWFEGCFWYFINDLKFPCLINEVMDEFVKLVGWILV